MITFICVLVGTALVFWAIWYGSWATTYLPGSPEDKKWLEYVLEQTQRGFIHWEVDKGRESMHKELKGRDTVDNYFHELSIHDKNARFLRSYDMNNQEEDGYTWNKPQLASITIKPWRPMNRLVQAALTQLKERKENGGKIKMSEPWPAPPEPTKPLFNLGWGEEPKWNKEIKQ